MDFRACCISLWGGLYAYPMGKHISTQPQVRSSEVLLLSQLSTSGGLLAPNACLRKSGWITTPFC